MKNLTQRLKLQLPSPSNSNPSCSTPNPPFLFVKPKPIKVAASHGYGRNSKHYPPSRFAITLREQTPAHPITLKDTTTVEDAHAPSPSTKLAVPENEHSRTLMMMGAVSVGIIVLLLSDQKAWALGPEGPLVEEFWDNVRRYALYALTVSTGALYTIFLPIFELLKNPITAILILAIFGGSFYIVSQVLSAMVGVSDFTYDYGY